MTYTIRDICDRFGVHEQTVLSWINVTKELKAINVGVAPGKKKPRWRITEAALAAFEESRATTPPPPPQRRRRKNASDINFY